MRFNIKIKCMHPYPWKISLNKWKKHLALSHLTRNFFHYGISPHIFPAHVCVSTTLSTTFIKYYTLESYIYPINILQCYTWSDVGPCLYSAGNSDLLVTSFALFFFAKFEFQNINYQFHVDSSEAGINQKCGEQGLEHPIQEPGTGDRNWVHFLPLLDILRT